MNEFQGPAKIETVPAPLSKFIARRKRYQFKILMILTLSSELKPGYQMNSYYQSKGCLTLKATFGLC